VQVDRNRAAALGVDMSDIAEALQLMVEGDQQVSRFHDPGINDDYDVQLRLSEGARNDRQAILGLYVPGRDGKLYQLGNFVTLTQETTASRVDRLDRQRQVSLRAGVAPGYSSCT
jgi:multidrug efflux pump subunit AcrB